MKTHILNLRIPEDLHSQLAERAVREERSVSQLVRILLKRAVSKEAMQRDIEDFLIEQGVKAPKQEKSKPRKEAKPKKEEETLILPPHLNSLRGQEAFNLWLQYKSEKRDPYKPTGLKMLISKMGNFYKSDEQMTKDIETAIANGWKGFMHDKAATVGGGKQFKTQREKNKEFFDRMLGGNKDDEGRDATTFEGTFERVQD